MSRKLLVFLLSELKTIRVICKNPECRVTSELPIEKLETKFQVSACPACRKQIYPPNVNPFLSLATAVEKFREWKDSIDIEFVFPDEEE
jgi:hypothetical protein